MKACRTACLERIRARCSADLCGSATSCSVPARTIVNVVLDIVVTSLSLGLGDRGPAAIVKVALQKIGAQLPVA